MSLTEHERRALRRIEDTLSAEEPALAALLREPLSTNPARTLRRLAGWSVWLAGLLLVLGLVVGEPAIWIGALLFLLVGPLTLRRIATAIADRS